MRVGEEVFVRLGRCDSIDGRMAGGEAVLHCDPGLTFRLTGKTQDPAKVTGKVFCLVSGFAHQGVVQGGVYIVAKLLLLQRLFSC